MTKPIPTSEALRHLFEDADSMGFMPRAELFTLALEGMRRSDWDDTVFLVPDISGSFEQSASYTVS